MRFIIKSTTYEGPTHHDLDYMDPNAPANIPYKHENIVEASDTEAARKNFEKDNPGVEINSVEAA